MATNTSSKSSAKKPAGRPRGPNKTATSAEIKAQIEKARAALLVLEQRAYANDLEEAIKKTNVVSDFNVIKSNAKGANDLIILAAIGKAVGIKRLEITQKPATTRSSSKKLKAA